MNLRPDEEASQAHINYDKKAAGFIKKGIGLAAGTAGFSGASRILPFLNELVPTELAIKGLKKVDPRIGEFVEKTVQNGFSTNNVLDFLRDQFVKPPEQNPPQETTQQKEHPILKEAKVFEANYPELAQALMRTMQNGQSAEAAAAILKQSTPFSKSIKKFEKEIGKNFVDFVVDLMGNQNQSMQQPQANQVQQQVQPQAQQQSGGVDPQLMQLVQGIRSSLQGIRGG
jgi:hypothetical protein